MAALAVVLAAPVSAQMAQIQLRASVPFDFVVGGQTMPAGDYLVRTVSNFGVLELRNESSGATPVLAMSDAANGSLQEGGAFLAFHRYGGDYFLTKIWDGSVAVGRSIPMSRTEQERAKSASIGKPEVVMVLARR